jgi:hypothetical protein
VLARIERLVARGEAAGVLRAEHLGLYPPLLLGMCRGLALKELYLDRGTDLTVLVAPLARFFLEGAALPPASSSR